jgi:hypothetical protein
MSSALLRHHIQTLRLRIDAPWPSRDWRHYLTLRLVP